MWGGGEVVVDECCVLSHLCKCNCLMSNVVLFAFMSYWCMMSYLCLCQMLYVVLFVHLTVISVCCINHKIKN